VNGITYKIPNSGKIIFRLGSIAYPYRRLKDSKVSRRFYIALQAMGKLGRFRFRNVKIQSSFSLKLNSYAKKVALKVL